MVTVTATEVKNRFGQIIDQARREPVLVQSHGRDMVVILDHAEYRHLRQLEDDYWVARAETALASGVLSADETMARLQARFGGLSGE